MSIESAKQFIQKVQSDYRLRVKIQNALSGTDEQKLATVVKIGGEAGFSFSAADYQEAMREAFPHRHGAGALDDQQLDSVAGGAVRRFTNVSVFVPPFIRRQPGC